MSMSTTAAEKAFLHQQIHTLNAKRVLEIGSFKGETTRTLSDAVAPINGVVVAIDPMRWASEVIRNGILRHLQKAFRPIFETIERWLPQTSYEREFWHQVRAAGHNNVHLYRHLSVDPELIQKEDILLERFDLVFVDGDHSYEGARADLENWGRRVRSGGQVLVHDATPDFPGVCKAIDGWKADPGVRVHDQRHGSICVIDVL
jgi:predicted O-methyltransferase YrrM